MLIGQRLLRLRRCRRPRASAPIKVRAKAVARASGRAILTAAPMPAYRCPWRSLMALRRPAMPTKFPRQSGLRSWAKCGRVGPGTVLLCADSSTPPRDAARTIAPSSMSASIVLVNGTPGPLSTTALAIDSVSMRLYLIPYKVSLNFAMLHSLPAPGSLGPMSHLTLRHGPVLDDGVSKSLPALPISQFSA